MSVFPILSHTLADDYYIEDRFGIERVVGDTIKLPVNPILIADRSWEDSVSSPQVIVDDEQGLFHMWYKGHNRTGYTVQMQQHRDLEAGQAPPYFVGYARSRDGVHWEKPDLDLHPLGGFDRTNVVAVGDKRAQEHNVFLNPDRSDPKRRYVMTYKDVNSEGSSSLMVATSEDGLDWKVDRDLSPIATNLRDGGHQVLYDDDRDRWLYYRRPPGLAQVSHLSVANIQRRYGVSINDHFSPDGWSYPRMVLTPEEEVDVPWIDHLTVLRWGTHFVGLWTGLDEHVEGLAETHIAVSRDGIRWTRFPHRPVFIGRGRAGDFDAGEVGVPRSAVIVGDQTNIYYTGNMAGQKANRGKFASIGVARMRTGRWVGVKADNPDGWLLTREMTVSGDRLELNHKELGSPTTTGSLPTTSAPRTCTTVVRTATCVSNSHVVLREAMVPTEAKAFNPSTVSPSTTAIPSLETPYRRPSPGTAAPILARCAASPYS